MWLHPFLLPFPFTCQSTTLPTYSSFPWNSKLGRRSELQQAEISSASGKSLVNPSCNRADQVNSSVQSGSIPSPLHSAHTPFQLLQAWQRLLPPVWEQFYFYSPVRLWFYDILWPTTPCQQPPTLQCRTWHMNGKDKAGCAASSPADRPSRRQAALKEAGGVPRDEAKRQKKKRTGAIQTTPNVFH